MLCYGYVALYAPASLIVSRLETTILKAINPHFNHVKVGRCPGVKNNRKILSEAMFYCFCNLTKSYQGRKLSC